MKRVLGCLLLLAIAVPATAMDIGGKWGIGASLFNGAGEASLIRGRSDHSAWLWNVYGSFQESRFGPNYADLLQISSGPGYRVFTRPNRNLSPYVDASLQVTCERGRQGSLHSLAWGGVADAAFGVEWQTPWAFSMAAHSDMLSIAWAHETGLGAGTRLFAIAQMNPRLVARVYF